MRNEPLLLMLEGDFLEDAMRESRVSRENLLEKIRASSAGSIRDVRAVILETTGDMSIIIGDYLDEEVMKGVRGYPRAASARSDRAAG